jgi:adenylylsulfate kinase-like enzyme
MRKTNRIILGNAYFEVFVDTPLSICQDRDPKGLYAKVKNEGLKNFTGIDSPFELPILADLVVKTENLSVDQAVNHILEQLTAE